MLVPDAADAQSSPPDILQTPAQAIAQDAGEYARVQRVPLSEAVARLHAQQDSAAITDQIRRTYRDRLAGIAIEHRPAFRVVVLLTGTQPVATRIVAAGGTALPIVFRTGAKATADDVVRAMLVNGPALASRFPNARGMGLDPRTGELVLLVTAADADRFGVDAIAEQVALLTGVPARVDVADPVATNLALAGGGRIEGLNPLDGKRYACTTGFVVGDGARSGIATAAHCPDEVIYRDPDGSRIPLSFGGQWGARTQDVQVNLVDSVRQPLFYANRRTGALRTLAGGRSRMSTRAGEWVCHWGESSGYSCAEVELVDFAPPGNLCAGPCAPTWVTVRTPDCHRGDSGGPVFLGDIAFGITKGGSGAGSGRCSFYFYMSTDFLPEPWRLKLSG